jgi:hypothetical protein
MPTPILTGRRMLGRASVSRSLKEADVCLIGRGLPKATSIAKAMLTTPFRPPGSMRRRPVVRGYRGEDIGRETAAEGTRTRPTHRPATILNAAANGPSLPRSSALRESECDQRALCLRKVCSSMPVRVRSNRLGDTPRS